MTQKINSIDYDKLVENSLRHVIKDTLKIIEKNGLIGEHHFYITFSTLYKGTSIPKAIAASYPEEMTIVIQHQYENLEVNDNDFSVTLSFNNVKNRVTVPYESVIYFADPYAKFGLKFTVENNLQTTDEEAVTNKKDTKDKEGTENTSKVVALDAFRKK